jgi:hypothetical protein
MTMLGDMTGATRTTPVYGPQRAAEARARGGNIASVTGRSTTIHGFAGVASVAGA